MRRFFNRMTSKQFLSYMMSKEEDNVSKTRERQ